MKNFASPAGGSNPEPAVPKTAALSIELAGRGFQSSCPPSPKISRPDIRVVTPVVRQVPTATSFSPGCGPRLPRTVNIPLNGHCPKCGNWLHYRDQDGDRTCAICGLVTVRRRPAPYVRPQEEPHRGVYRRRPGLRATAELLEMTA